MSASAGAVAKIQKATSPESVMSTIRSTLSDRIYRRRHIPGLPGLCRHLLMLGEKP
ncbi:Insulin-degrading enzyme [Clarias magur]|uniref:Insulin-degrading enzyme n=1 Tax=Clarias magur TaxID=1594786 RepID=A0A8J4X235_CLAMG|nr:Insulin-degrading enzyme [Clarias magur]